MAKIEIVKGHVDKLINFLSIHSKLSQGHMVDYFINNLYDNCVPTDVKDEIAEFGLNNIVKFLLNEETVTNVGDIKELISFVKESKSLSLYNLTDVCLSKQEFFDLYKFPLEGGLKLDVFMKEKKSHEVETLSLLAKHIANYVKTSHLVDIGDGKGYLSSLIAFHHKLPVLGVDGSNINTESSVKRANKLEKHWEHLTDKNYKLKDMNTKKNQTNNERSFLYKQITQLVTPKTDFNTLIQNVFLVKPTGIGLIGLHTCGNLGPNSIRIFNENKDIKSIINVSCCYHLLNENYLANSSMGHVEYEDGKLGFPMSAYIKTNFVDFVLKRQTRMLSAHSLDRILHNKELPSKIIFYRALFEIVLDKMHIKGRNVGKFRKQPVDFVQYAREASGKLGIVLQQSDKDLNDLYEMYKDKKEELDVFYLLRSMVAPAIEALILLDRCLFLLEEGHDNVFLVKLFDAVISPRCYGLICLRI